MSDDYGTIADEAPAEDAGQSAAEASSGDAGGVGGEPAVGGSEGEGEVRGTIADEDEPSGAGEAQNPAAPEEYVLEVDEKTFPMPKENVASFTATCRKAGLSKAQAEAVLGWHKAQYAATQKWDAQTRDQTIAAWNKAVREDPEFGGANYKATVADARKALKAFDTDGSLRKLLKSTGGEHHPAVVKIIAKVGKALGEHQFVGGAGGGGAKASAPLWQRMYGKGE